MNIVEQTRKLISIPSYVVDSSSTNEHELGEYIFEFLEGLKYLKVSKQSVEGSRFNVIAHDGYPPKLMFCCHMDTVPSSGQWEYSPLKADVTDGKIYGLGACDMKGGIAALLTALQAFNKVKGLFLLFDVDEEYYFKGMLKFLKEHKIAPDLAVFPEPGLEIGNGHRGLIEVSFRVRGVTGHASRPELGRNAILGATHAVESLISQLGVYEHPILGKSTCNLAYIHGGIDEEGRIGNRPNKIPDITEVVLDLRPAVPTLRAASALEFISNNLEANGFKLEHPEKRLDFGSLFVPREELSDLEAIVKQSLGEAKYADISIGGYGEGQLLNEKYGTKCVYFGPGPKQKGHQVDEFVDIAQLESACGVYKALIEKYCAP